VLYLDKDLRRLKKDDVKLNEKTEEDAKDLAN
jgi:hypothetical protein